MRESAPVSGHNPWWSAPANDLKPQVTNGELPNQAASDMRVRILYPHQVPQMIKARPSARLYGVSLLFYGQVPFNLKPWSFGPIVGTLHMVPFNSYAEPAG